MVSDLENGNVQYIDLLYDPAKSDESALRLVCTLFPSWEREEGKIEFIRFKDGITNTLMKAIKKRPSLTEEQLDEESVLLRAYGQGTEVLIDRDREEASHTLLSRNHLAPTLLARFANGLLYRFIRGTVCAPSDLRREPVWRGVARRIGEWHAVLPVAAATRRPSSLTPESPNTKAIRTRAPCRAAPNVWTVMQKWTNSLPTETDVERQKQDLLHRELERSLNDLGKTPGFGGEGLVFGHCDLLSGNVIVEPRTSATAIANVETVSFIDYEYATSAPAAFDLANHFSEWGGFDCDYNVLPTRSQRRAFIKEYIQSYKSFQKLDSKIEYEARIFEEVDLFRGMPGLYWGIWALIQATISTIDFPYAEYAETRLAEYFAWRAERDGVAQAKTVRERRWAEE